MIPTNYRPISLLTSFSKVFEKALYIRLIEHSNINKLLVGNKFGFRKGIATEDAIFKLTNEMLNALNNKAMAGNIFCDLEKAFDSVNHDILLSKLPYYEVSDKDKLLLESYLQNRYQRVHHHKLVSYFKHSFKMDENKICGTAGLDFDPLLFLVYINYLPKAVEHKALPSLFSDDNSILFKSPNCIHM